MLNDISDTYLEYSLWTVWLMSLTITTFQGGGAHSCIHKASQKAERDRLKVVLHGLAAAMGIKTLSKRFVL